MQNISNSFYMELSILETRLVFKVENPYPNKLQNSSLFCDVINTASELNTFKSMWKSG